MEKVENIELVEGDPSKTDKVRNLDVFAWSHEDMLEIDEDVIEHC